MRIMRNNLLTKLSIVLLCTVALGFGVFTFVHMRRQVETMRRTHERLATALARGISAGHARRGARRCTHERDVALRGRDLPRSRDALGARPARREFPRRSGDDGRRDGALALRRDGAPLSHHAWGIGACACARRTRSLRARAAARQSPGPGASAPLVRRAARERRGMPAMPWRGQTVARGHRDHARHDARAGRTAIQCGVEMVEAVRALAEARGAAVGALAIGVGINAGDVVIGAMGSMDRMDFTVIGDAVNVGSRLCSAARPGQVLVSLDTARAAEPLLGIDLGPLESLSLKGKSEPLPVVVAQRKSEGERTGA